MNSPLSHTIMQSSSFRDFVTWVGLVLLAAVALGCAAALQWLSPAAARGAIGAAWLAIALGPLALPALGRRRAVTLAMTIALVPLWFAGFDSPFHWDAVQTVIRAAHFWHTGEMERFSILFAVLAPVTAAFPANAVAPHLFMMTCGLGALAAVAALTRRVAGRVWAGRALLLAMVFPPLWLLFRFVMLEAFLVLLWSATLLAALAWARRLTPWRAAGLAALVLLTAAAKETGALVVVPVITALVALAPRAERRRRWMFAGALVVVAGVIGVIVAARYAYQFQIESFVSGIIYTDRGLTFLPFNQHFDRPWVNVMTGMGWQHVFYWAQTGLVVPAVLAFMRLRSARAGMWLVGLGVAAQAVWIVTTPQHLWPDTHTFPLFNPRTPALAAGMLFAFLFLVFLLVARGEALWRCNRRALVLAMSVLPLVVALLLFAKTAPAGGGKFYVWLQWHYLSPAVVGMIPLAAMGLRRAGRWALPGWLRGAAGAVIVATLASGLIGTMGIAARWRGEDLARLEAYRQINAPDAPAAVSGRKVVHTHWPFAYLGTGIGYHNNGPLAWERDGWRVLALSDVATTGGLPHEGAVMLYDVARGYGLNVGILDRLGGHVSQVEGDLWRPSLLNIGFSITSRGLVQMRCLEWPCIAPFEESSDAGPH